MNFNRRLNFVARPTKLKIEIIAVYKLHPTKLKGVPRDRTPAHSLRDTAEGMSRPLSREATTPDDTARRHTHCETLLRHTHCETLFFFLPRREEGGQHSLRDTADLSTVTFALWSHLLQFCRDNSAYPDYLVPDTKIRTHTQMHTHADALGVPVTITDRTVG
jgi:hypothetical protein